MVLYIEQMLCKCYNGNMMSIKLQGDHFSGKPGNARGKSFWESCFLRTKHVIDRQLAMDRTKSDIRFVATSTFLSG